MYLRRENDRRDLVTRSDTDPAVYVDEKGENIKLPPGKTWICIIWMEYADDVIRLVLND